MGWYSVRCLYKRVKKSKRKGKIRRPYKTAIFVVEAENRQEACEKVFSLPINKLTNRNTKNRDDIDWYFCEILEVDNLCVDELRDGVEVFNRLHPSSTEAVF